MSSNPICNYISNKYSKIEVKRKENKREGLTLL